MQKFLSIKGLNQEPTTPSNNGVNIKLKSALKKIETGLLELNPKSPLNASNNKALIVPKTPTNKIARPTRKLYTKEEIEDFQLIRRNFLDKVQKYNSKLISS
jgi:hypothetical protein